MQLFWLTYALPIIMVFTLVLLDRKRVLWSEKLRLNKRYDITNSFSKAKASFYESPIDCFDGESWIQLRLKKNLMFNTLPLKAISFIFYVLKECIFWTAFVVVPIYVSFEGTFEFYYLVYVIYGVSIAFNIIFKILLYRKFKISPNSPFTYLYEIYNSLFSGLLILIVVVLFGNKSLFAEKDNFKFNLKYSRFGKKGSIRNILVKDKLSDQVDLGIDWANNQPSNEKITVKVEFNVFSSPISGKFNIFFFLIRFLTSVLTILSCPFRLMAWLILDVKHVHIYNSGLLYFTKKSEKLRKEAIQINESVVGSWFPFKRSSIDTIIRNWKSWKLIL